MCLRNGCRNGAGLLLVLGLVGAPVAVRAHRLVLPKRDTVTICRSHVTVALRLDFDDEQSAAIRDRFDRDGDRRISESESPALERYLAQETQRHFVLRVNGAAPPLTLTAKALQSAHAEVTHAQGVGIDIVVEANLPESEVVQLEIRDRASEGEVGLRLVVESGRIDSFSEGRIDNDGRQQQSLKGVSLSAAETFSASIRFD